MIPIISPFVAASVCVKGTDLPTFCLFGGLATVFSLPYIGQVADRHGKRQIFTLIGLISIAPQLIATNLPAVPVAIGASLIIMEFVSGRFVPPLALVIFSGKHIGAALNSTYWQVRTASRWCCYPQWSSGGFIMRA